MKVSQAPVFPRAAVAEVGGKGPDEAAARGIYASVYALSDGAAGAIVIAPGDARGAC